MAAPEMHPSALLHLLSNSLVLAHTAPYLSCRDVLNLAASSRAFYHLVRTTPEVWRRLDLTGVPRQTAQVAMAGLDRGGHLRPDVQRLRENAVTEDDFYSGPLRAIFTHLRRADVLRNVQTLILDGLSVTAELVHEILTDPSFSVRLLSLRHVKGLDEFRLCAALRYACRPTRPAGTPTVRGIYIFGPQDAAIRPAPASVSPKALASCREAEPEPGLEPGPEPWYVHRGVQLPRRPHGNWPSTLRACDGVVAFDAVLCTGPRHLTSPAWGTVDFQALDAAATSSVGVLPFDVATHSLGPCAGCGTAPEGLTIWGQDLPPGHGGQDRGHKTCSEAGRFPLLAPPPFHAAHVRAAMCPAGQPTRPTGNDKNQAAFVPRCARCLRDRYCARCHRWWCETCYLGPLVGAVLSEHGQGAHDTISSEAKPRVSKSCWECGNNCHECIGHTQRMCRRCRGLYCLIHNEGSDQQTCDWCAGREGLRRELY